ncbi:anthrone oxygenase family protein [Micromonospora sp. BQ11]|uniref:anthrone oxygenase family protein n=1 Tax=Micromonospora sp. BQ11 TaxID=3452212 RepID=UPI003F8CC8D9
MATAVLVLATVTTGLMAGLYLAFSVAVMPALARVDDTTFVRVMQRINDAIQNPLFGLVFVGALIAGGAAVWWHLDRGDVRWWVLAGAAGYAVTVVSTVAANIPLNNRLDRAGPVDRLADARAVRRDFERPWVRWHTLRTLVCVLAFGCLCVALSVA